MGFAMQQAVEVVEGSLSSLLEGFWWGVNLAPFATAMRRVELGQWTSDNQKAVTLWISQPHGLLRPQSPQLQEDSNVIKGFF